MEQDKGKENEIITQTVSRKNFIKLAAITAIGISAGKCASVDETESNEPKSKKPGTNDSQKESKERSDFDVVVIGTGMGGSAAGAIAARNGLRTLVLEKNPRPGGACSYYEKEGFRIDVGAHMFIRGNDGPFGEVTRRLGMGTPIDFEAASNTLQIKGINMNTIFPSNFFLRFLIYLPKLAIQTGINPLHYPSILNLFFKIYFMSESQIKRLDNITIEQFMLKYTKNEEVRSMIAGILGLMVIVPPDYASAGESIWNLQKMISEMSVGYPKGGCSIISRTFLKGAEKYGAHVRMNAGVRKIIVKNGRVDSVILTSGEKIKTRTVISTTSVKDTILRLAGAEYFPADYARDIKKIMPSFSAVQAKLALRTKLVYAGCLIGGLPIKSEKNIIGEFTGKAFSNAARGIQGEYIPIYAPVPSTFDNELAPPGCQLVTAVALAPHLDIELKDTSQSWIDGMMRTLRAMIPDLDKNLIFCDTWSVKQLAGWTGKSDGSAISTGQTVGQVYDKRPAHRTSVKGLYLAGDCAGPARGVGTELACQSGMDCADLVARDFANSLI